MNRGFTLVELIITLGIFGLLMVVGTDLLIKTIQNGNRATIESEVRQNANSIMQDIAEEIRLAETVTTPEVPAGSGNHDLVLNNPMGSKRYHVNPTDGVLTKDGTILTSKSVAVLSCPSCGSTSCAGGMVSTVNPTGTVTVTLTVQQNLGVNRSDFCAKVVLTNTVTPRQF